MTENWFACENCSFLRTVAKIWLFHDFVSAGEKSKNGITTLLQMAHVAGTIKLSTIHQQFHTARRIPQIMLYLDFSFGVEGELPNSSKVGSKFGFCTEILNFFFPDFKGRVMHINKLQVDLGKVTLVL